MAEYRHLATPDPQWVDFPHNLPQGTSLPRGMPSSRLPITPDPALSITDFTIPSRDSHSITVRSYIPVSQSSLPLLVFLHGGGFCFGGLESDDAALRVLARSLHLAVLNVEYRLAPDHPFPAGLQDSHDAVVWAASAAGRERLRTDLSRGFLLGGISAGANFSAVIAHLVVAEGLSPPLTGLVLSVAGVCHPDARPEKYKGRLLSIDEVATAPGLSRKAIDYFAGVYGASPTDPRLSPLLFPSHEGLAPKAYFQVCGWDPRRDDGLLFGQLLEETGTAVKTDVYPGLPHGFWGMAPDMPVSQKWQGDLVEGTRWLLEQKLNRHGV